MNSDVVVVGTGLTESIVAAALSKAGFTVIHIDSNPYYGGDQASLNVEELAQWADQQQQTSSSSQNPKFTSISRSSSFPPNSRQFSLSLSPALIPSTGPLIDSLVSSGVSRYGGFKLLETVALYDGPDRVQAVPGSKEDVFKSKTLSLLEKRRLMRFLTFATGKFEEAKELVGQEMTPFVSFLESVFSLNETIAQTIAYALAYCTSQSDATFPALQRLRRYLLSTGRYGPSPFLVGHYGGLGELAQGFCRTAAVGGSTYILNQHISEILHEELSDASADSENAKTWTIKLQDFPEVLSCDALISSGGLLPPSLNNMVPVSHPSEQHRIVRGFVIIDKPIHLSSQDETETMVPQDIPSAKTNTGYNAIDTALILFPPGKVEGGSQTSVASVLVTGEGTLSAPRGYYILHLSLPLSPSETQQDSSQRLTPYLKAALSLVNDDSANIEPVFTLFYTEDSTELPGGTEQSTVTARDFVAVPDTTCSYLPEVADAHTKTAEEIFWQAVEILKHRGGKEGHEEIDSFWPPLDLQPGYDDEDS
ncbi:rab escort protein [Abortiporus biennis]|nr:rab escort protein [Abortiporus biennis]